MTTTTTINNAEVLNTVTTNHMVEGFKAFTKNWPVKFAGPVPTVQMLMVSLVFGKNKKPGPEAGFVAMQLRPEGASVAELSAAFNSGPAHNHSRALSADNKGNGAHYFVRTKGNGRFWLTFTQKGIKALERALQGMAAQAAAGTAEVAADKPKAKKGTPVAKRGKATSKPRKPKGGHVPEALVELERQHAETVDQHQLEGPTDSPDQGTNDGQGTPNQQQQPTT